MASSEWKKANQDKLREYRRTWYRKNKAKAIEKSVNRKKVIRNWIKEYKSRQSCSICHEDHPACLDFHHLGNKEANIGNLVSKGWSLSRIQKEIDKCVVLCANCHRKEHYKASECSKAGD